MTGKWRGRWWSLLSGVTRVTLLRDVPSSSSNLKLPPLVFVNYCVTLSSLIFWHGSGTWELERKRAGKLTALRTAGVFFCINFSLTLWLEDSERGRVVVEKIVYSEWWLFRAWLTTGCWKAFDIFSFDNSNHVGQEKILIFLIGIQQPQELRVPFKYDLSDTIKDVTPLCGFQSGFAWRKHFELILPHLQRKMTALCCRKFVSDNYTISQYSSFSPRLPNTHCWDKAELSPLICHRLSLLCEAFT